MNNLGTSLDRNSLTIFRLSLFYEEMSSNKRLSSILLTFSRYLPPLNVLFWPPRPSPREMVSHNQRLGSSSVLPGPRTSTPVLSRRPPGVFTGWESRGMPTGQLTEGPTDQRPPTSDRRPGQRGGSGRRAQTDYSVVRAVPPVLYGPRTAGGRRCWGRCWGKTGEEEGKSPGNARVGRASPHG